MKILDPVLEDYLSTLQPARDAVLAEMECYGAEKDFPLIGPLCGQVLQQLAILSNAKRIFEMGSGFGYSAIWFARGLPETGRIICTDGDAKNRDRALAYFERAGVADKIEFRVGNAQDILASFDAEFDIIFNDVDKQEYPATIDLVLPRLRSGGLFITDNALWDGKVTEEPDDKYTNGVQKFNQALFGRHEFLSSIIPLRDGMAMAVKR